MNTAWQAFQKISVPAFPADPCSLFFLHIQFRNLSGLTSIHVVEAGLLLKEFRENIENKDLLLLSFFFFLTFRMYFNQLATNVPLVTADLVSNNLLALPSLDGPLWNSIRLPSSVMLPLLDVFSYCFLVPLSLLKSYTSVHCQSSKRVVVEIPALSTTSKHGPHSERLSWLPQYRHSRDCYFLLKFCLLTTLCHCEFWFIDAGTILTVSVNSSCHRHKYLTMLSIVQLPGARCTTAQLRLPPSTEKVA